MTRSLVIALTGAVLLGGCGENSLSPAVGARSSPALIGAKTGALLYVGNAADGSVAVYSYGTHARVQTLTGFRTPAGLCSDTNGHVFVTDSGARAVYEFDHGGSTPIATLSTTIYDPAQCAADSRTGSLAVAALSSTSGTGGLLVFAKGHSTPSAYLDVSLYHDDACGFDASGDVFVDGTSQQGTFALAELRSGEGSLSAITLDRTIAIPIGIQNEGGYFAFGAGGSSALANSQSAILHVIVTGKSARVVQTTHLQGAERFFVIDGSTLVGSDGSHDKVRFFAYPQGSLKSNPIALARPTGVALSTAAN